MAVLSQKRLGPLLTNWLRVGVILGLLVVLGEVSFSERRLSATDDLCAIFKEKPHWYVAAKQAAKQWGGNLHVPMAMMFYESRFKAQARTPVKYLWGWLPVGRISSAYGYAQAIDSTWARYERATGGDPKWRNRFEDAIDFMQWYMHQTKRINQIPKSDAYRQYLNYHEGQHGYNRQEWKSKSWLLKVARRAERRATKYAGQMKQCEID